MLRLRSSPGMAGILGIGIEGGKLGRLGNGIASDGIARSRVSPGIAGIFGNGMLGGKLGRAGSGMLRLGIVNAHALMFPWRR